MRRSRSVKRPKRVSRRRRNTGRTVSRRRNRQSKRLSLRNRNSKRIWYFYSTWSFFCIYNYGFIYTINTDAIKQNT